MRYTLDFSTKLKGFDGVALREGLGTLTGPITQAINEISAELPATARETIGKKLDDTFGKEMTLASVATNSLLGAHEDEKNLGGEEKVRRFELARRFTKGGMQEFNTTERELIKTLAGKNYRGPLIYGLVVELLESAEKVKEEEKKDAPTGP